MQPADETFAIHWRSVSSVAACLNLLHRDPRELLSPHPGQNALAPFISEVPDWFREFMRVTADLTHVRDEAMPFAST